jgi:transposase
MMVPSRPVRVLVATKPVDFRKGMDGLAALVQEYLKADPFSGTLFVFRAKRADRVKLIWWDGSGLCCSPSDWSRVASAGPGSRMGRSGCRRRNSRRSSRVWSGRECKRWSREHRWRRSKLRHSDSYSRSRRDGLWRRWWGMSYRLA